MIKTVKFEIDKNNRLPHCWGDCETLTEDFDRNELKIEDLKYALRFCLEKKEVLAIEIKKWDGLPW